MISNRQLLLIGQESDGAAEVMETVRHLCGHDVSRQAILKKIGKIKAKKTQLRKLKKKVELEEFLSGAVNFCEDANERAEAEEVDENGEERLNNPTTLSSMASTAVASLAATGIDHVKAANIAIEEKKKELKVLSDRLSISRYSPANVRRRDARADKARNDLRLLRKDYDSFKSNRVSSPCAGCASKRTRLASQNNQILCLDLENASLRSQVEALKAQIEEMTNNGKKSFPPKKEGKFFSPVVRHLYSSMIGLGIKPHQMTPVVETVLSHAGVDVDGELPSTSWCKDLKVESLIVDEAAVADKILKSEVPVTLQLDGTKKRFRDYGAFQVSEGAGDSRTSLSVGVSEMARTDANAYLDRFEDHFTDITESWSRLVSSSDSSVDTARLYTEIVMKIKNLMTDRCSVNKLFTEKFIDLRRDLCIQNIPDFAEKPLSEREELVRVHGLYCGLHVIGNMGSSAKKGLNEFVASAADTQGPNISQSSFGEDTNRVWDLVNECSQALTRSGNQRSGCAGDWENFLHTRQVKNQIKSFLHHRFGVIFDDGGAIYHHHHQRELTDFLDKYAYQENPNRLLRTIRESLDSPLVIAGLRALGLFGKCISSPLWIQIEEPNVHVLDLNPVWLDLITNLRDLSEDPSPVLRGESVFGPLRDDVVFASLLAPVSEELENFTRSCLKCLSSAVLQMAERQLVDQLPGGKFSDTDSPTLRHELQSCVPTNRFGEAIFSSVDRLVNACPTKSVEKISAEISSQHSSNRLARKSFLTNQRLDFDFSKRVYLAAKDRRTVLKNRREQIKVDRRRMLEERALKVREKERRLLERQIDITNRLRPLGGPWARIEPFLAALDNLSDSSKLKIAKDQMRWLVQAHSAKPPLGCLSVAGKQKSLTELTRDIRKILETSELPPEF